MLKQLNYVLRTLSHGRGANAIKVVSLGLGLTMSILLFSRVAYEQSFDTHYRDVDRLYQVWSQFTVNGEALPWQEQNLGPLAGAILENFPQQVEAATAVSIWSVHKPLYAGTVRFDVGKVAADSLFFRTMGVEVFSGNPVKDLAHPDVVFLSESLARRIFDQENPIGKTISYGREFELIVRGIFADVPENSTLNIEAVVSLPTVFKHVHNYYSWDGGDSWQGYVRLRPGVDAAAVNSRLDAMIGKYRFDEDKSQLSYTAKMAPLRDTYRKSEEVRRMVAVMSILGFSILFITTLNYVLISISSFSHRAKLVGVHKCSGAGRGTVLFMFMIETLLIVMGALVVMGIIVFGFRDFVEDTASASLASLFASERLWVPTLVVGVLFAVGGLLPGLQLARIPVTQVFRRYSEGKRGWKRTLLFVQFAGVAFICGLMYVVSLQYRYVLDKDMGYRPTRVAVGELYPSDDASRHAAYQFFKGLPYVEKVASAQSTPLYGYSGCMIRDNGGKTLFSARSNFYATAGFYDLMNMELREGRMPVMHGSEKNECVVNETYVDRMRWTYPVVGNHSYRVNLGDRQVKVVGVLKDFQIRNFFSEPQPFLGIGEEVFYGYIHVRLKEPFADNLKKLNLDVAEAFPNKTIDFVDYEKEITRSYNSVRVFRNATLMAAVTMFFVMLMGLIGYTADEVHRRSKEIAIRKVNGAGVGDILRLLARDVWVVALPAVLTGMVSAWYVNNQWIAAFAERISVSPFTYLLLFVAVVAVIMACVLLKSLAIAHENPVKSIKSE